MAPPPRGISDWLTNDRKLSILTSGGVAIYFVAHTVRGGVVFDNGYPHPSLLIALLAVVFCIGLIYRQEWSRWVGMAFFLGMVENAAWRTYQFGVTGLRVGLILLSPGLIWYMLRLPITKNQEILTVLTSDKVRDRVARIQRELVSQRKFAIKLFYTEPVSLDSSRLAQIAERAFGTAFQVVERDFSPLDAAFIPRDYPYPVICGKSRIHICHVPPALLVIYNYSGFQLAAPNSGVEQVAQHVTTRTLGQLEVELAPQANAKEGARSYSQTGKLAAELLDHTCVGVIIPEEDRFLKMSDTLLADLRNGLSSSR